MKPLVTALNTLQITSSSLKLSLNTVAHDFFNRLSHKYHVFVLDLGEPWKFLFQVEKPIAVSILSLAKFFIK